MNLWTKLFFISILLSVILALQPGGKNTLVIIESPSVKTTHSSFFKHLESLQYKLDFHTEDDIIQFRSYGEWNYDHLILFAPSLTELPTGLTVKTVLEFIDDGHNVLVVGGSDIGKPVLDIASDCNVEFDEEGTYVIDHLSYNGSDANGQHTLLAFPASNVISSQVIFPKPIDSPVLYKGIGQDIEEDSTLLFCVLKGNPSSYSYFPDEAIEDLHVAGSKTCLVSALQARNNARVVFAGSLELFSNNFANSAVSIGDNHSPKSSNEKFTTQLVEWLFQERGILRSMNVKHHLVGETVTPFTYRIKDQVEYSVEIQQWNGKEWVPFVASDVQLEFRMLDPYVRTTLKHDKNGRYFTSFKLPDVYGVFTFKIEYIRLGYGFLTDITRVPVRPFRHNEYERFIGSAFPYYTSAFSMMVGLFLMSWFFLYHRETKG